MRDSSVLLGTERDTPTWSVYSRDNPLTQFKTCCGTDLGPMRSRHMKAFVLPVPKGLGGMLGGAPGLQEERRLQLAQRMPPACPHRQLWSSQLDT